MYLTLQTLLEQSNSKILLKYDGERVKNCFTIRQFDKKDPLNSKGRDTNTPEKVLNELLKDMGSKDNADIYKNIFGDFCKIKNILIDNYGEKVVVSLAIDVENVLKFTFSVSNINVPVRYSCYDINELIKYCNEMSKE